MPWEIEAIYEKKKAKKMQIHKKRKKKHLQ